MICARIDTSSAETGSSSTISRVLVDQRPGDGDALALPAAEFVREQVRHVRPQPDELQHLRHPLPHALARDRSVWISSGSAMMSPTRMRGLSELYGSWNTTCTARR